MAWRSTQYQQMQNNVQCWLLMLCKGNSISLKKGKSSLAFLNLVCIAFQAVGGADVVTAFGDVDLVSGPLYDDARLSLDSALLDDDVDWREDAVTALDSYTRTSYSYALVLT